MKRIRIYISYIFLSIGLLICPGCISQLEAKDFVLVIDPGHGGHDPGAIGRIAKEKNINLQVGLKLGRLVQQHCPDVKVIYTRNKDVFIPLDRRAEIANNAKADLFISIHTNALANNRSYKGASTWTLGLAKSDANLEVAKRENAVILYENDYQTRYAGFNPNSSESYIIFELMQDKYMSQSVHLASLVQKQFKNTCRRLDRGVHQAGFLVLKASAMPSILVELGFISSPDEEKYLASDLGSSNLANGIFRAFLTYKREQEIRLNGSSKTILPDEAITDLLPDEDSEDQTEQRKETNSKTQPAVQPEIRNTARPVQKNGTLSSQNDPVFKIQILVSTRKLAENDRQFKGIKNTGYYREKGLYKYTVGTSSDYHQILRTLRTVKLKFKDAFIIAFKNGKKVNTQTAIQEFKRKHK